MKNMKKFDGALLKWERTSLSSIEYFRQFPNGSIYAWIHTHARKLRQTYYMARVESHNYFSERVCELQFASRKEALEWAERELCRAALEWAFSAALRGGNE